MPPGDVGVLVQPDEIVMMEMTCEFADAQGPLAEFLCRDVGVEDSDRTTMRALLKPAENGFDLQLDDYKPFRIIPCEKPTS